MSRFTLFSFLSIITVFLFVCGDLAHASIDGYNPPQHAIALDADPKYGVGFTHFDYANPDATKSGKLRVAVIGTYDSLHPYILKGIAAAGIGLTAQTLMESSDDEAFSKYGSVAKSMRTHPENKGVIFDVHETAKFHDGTPITADDIVWGFDILREVGNPFYKAYYRDVKQVRALSQTQVEFLFVEDVNNKELPLILGQIPIMSKAYWNSPENDFTKTTLTAPLGSGPYRVKNIKAGQSISFERVKDWWAKDLSLNRGRYNFDEIEFVYFRDDSVALQAFLSGDVDVRQEYTAKTWATSYQGDAVKDGRIIKAEIANQLPTGMQAFIYNIRRDIFKDKDVREAIAYAFDFEWSNKQFAYGAYNRTISYFSNSELASSGVPSVEEVEILDPFKAQLPKEIFNVAYQPPTTDGSGNNRRQLKQAMDILNNAGWVLGADKIRVKDGARLSFEIIVNNPAFERWFNPFIKNLKRMGVEAKLRVLDTAQYQNRIDQFDFDMTVHVFGQSNSPGNEQRDYWHSSKVDVAGTRNLIGIADPVIDALVDLVIQSPDRETLVHRTRALDRVLLSGHYLIPNWHINSWRVGHWHYLKRPDVTAPYGLGIFDRWWIGERAN